MKLLGKILCFFGFHQKAYVYPVPDNYVGGVFGPRKCCRDGCGWKWEGIMYTPCPPMPRVRKPRKDD